MYNLLEVLAAGEADEKALELCRALNHAKRHRHGHRTRTMQPTSVRDHTGRQRETRTRTRTRAHKHTHTQTHLAIGSGGEMATAVVNLEILGCKFQQCLCCTCANQTGAHVHRKSHGGTEAERRDRGRKWESGEGSLWTLFPNNVSLSQSLSLNLSLSLSLFLSLSLSLSREAKTLWASGQRSCIHNHTVVSLRGTGRARQRVDDRG